MKMMSLAGHPGHIDRTCLPIASHYQQFPGTYSILFLILYCTVLLLEKPPYLRMTSVLTIPAYMSGFLHELGRESGSGVYRYNATYKLLS